MQVSEFSNWASTPSVRCLVSSLRGTPPGRRRSVRRSPARLSGRRPRRARTVGTRDHNGTASEAHGIASPLPHDAGRHTPRDQRWRILTPTTGEASIPSSMSLLYPNPRASRPGQTRFTSPGNTSALTWRPPTTVDVAWPRVARHVGVSRPKSHWRHVDDRRGSINERAISDSPLDRYARLWRIRRRQIKRRDPAGPPVQGAARRGR
jgi:hypothetical protein